MDAEVLPPAGDPFAQTEQEKSGKLFSWMFVAGGIGAGIASVFDSHSGLFTSWDNYLTAITSTLYFVSGLIIRLRPKWLRGAILLSLIPTVIYLQGVMYLAVHQPGAASLYSASSSGPFAPLIYVVLFIAMPRGASLLSWISCAGFYVQFLLNITWLSESLPSPGRLEGEHLLVEAMMSHPIYIISLSYIVRLRERLHAAQAESFKQKESLLGMLSHEIRNQMQTMLSAIDLLDFRLKDPAERRSVQHLQGAMARLQTYLNDIKELTTLENPALTIEKKPFDLARLVDDIGDEWSEHARSQGLELTVIAHGADEHSSSASIMVDTDETRLRQVLSNLVSNAIKYTKAGGVAISASLSSESPGCFKVEVADTGIGIDERYLESIFLPHVRLENASGVRAEGSGLGLSIVKRLVANLGGVVKVESRLQRGTVFRVIVPGLIQG